VAEHQNDAIFFFKIIEIDIFEKIT